MSLSKRPQMKGRDSSGREVSLLNNPSQSVEEYSPQSQPHQLQPIQTSQPQPCQISFRDTWDSYGASGNSRSYSSSSPHMVRTNSNVSASSNTSVPGLLRSDSYDSHYTNEAQSPITPTFTPTTYGRNNSFPTQYGKDYPLFERNSMDEFRPNSSVPIDLGRYHSEEQPFNHENAYHEVTERGPNRRHPCRFKDSHQCFKTFTTSGHASRHAKIHTAEKMVRCTYAGCMKKFTRADNMKQHLDTHYKDKARPSSSTTSSTSRRLNGRSPLTMPAGVQKKNSSSTNIQSPRPKLPSRMSSSDIPAIDLRDSGYHMQYHPWAGTSQPSHPSDQESFRGLPTRSKPANNLDLLADVALN